jgi:hypothetical protein
VGGRDGGVAGGCGLRVGCVVGLVCRGLVGYSGGSWLEFGGCRLWCVGEGVSGGGGVKVEATYRRGWG